MLMLASSSFGKKRRAERCGVSSKRRNAADGLLSITQKAGLLCLLTPLDHASGGKHHPPRRAIASSADKGETVKWCTPIARWS